MLDSMKWTYLGGVEVRVAHVVSDFRCRSCSFLFRSEMELSHLKTERVPNILGFFG